MKGVTASGEAAFTRSRTGYSSAAARGGAVVVGAVTTVTVVVADCAVADPDEQANNTTARPNTQRRDFGQRGEAGGIAMSIDRRSCPAH